MPEHKRTATGVLGGLVGLVGLSAVAGLLVAATVTPAIAVTGAAASSAISIFDNMPSILKIDKLMQPTTIWTGDQVLAQFYDQNRQPVEFDEVAPVMYDAILSSEDPRYYQHGGVDLIGTTRALLSNAQGGQTQGGSSISQQYVKNVLIQKCERDATAERDDAGNEIRSRDEVLQSCWTEATTASGVEGYERKLQEMRYAIQLEKEYSKNDILLGYLNIANFGGTNYGIEAAARYYFNVPAAELSLGQAATLAGIVQNPNTYRIDRGDRGTIFDADGVAYNKAPDGSIDDVNPGTIQALNTLRDEGTITPEQYLAAADGYSATKGRQLYVLSRLLDDGKITRDQYVAAAVEPITPQITPASQGCAASAAPYYCQYVVSVIRNDPAFGETGEERLRSLRQDGLNIHTTLAVDVQNAAQQAMNDYAPASVEGMRFGSASVSIEAKTGRVLAMAQNTRFTEDADVAASDPAYTSIVYAGDRRFGASDGFNAGSTFKLFTLVDWLEQGRSVNEVVNGRDRPVPNMTNSCFGNYVNTDKARIRNFNNQGGYNGTPMQFTRQSLNTGFLGMAAELDLCDIAKVAKKMGVTLANGNDIEMRYGNNVIGSDAVSPLAMAGAYATVANGGVYCEPKVIDRVTDSDGTERPELVPVRSCTPVLSPEVAATAASALAGVMNGGTGAQGNPYDGTPLIGKTGTHESLQSWMIESSTNVTTAVWAGTVEGQGDIARNWYNGRRLMDIRYPIARVVQGVANQFYGGDPFPAPDNNLTRRVTREVPNVVGQTVDQATATLTDAGWEVVVGEPVDSDQPTDIVAAQNPAGSAPGGTPITINPSNGQAGAVPDVTGQAPVKALATLRQTFPEATLGTCTEDPEGGPQGRVTGTDPAAGSVVPRSAAITIDYTSEDCD
ncbi:transglycosylase domain-containing protein [Microbacterium lushaniae]|uniref:PASTA domain-containing protein n=1 Tax=Microbacterium lushaniae TaxID=2614639 RepID=A0A5J6L683_9MICO|nr:transglycosylase domain-containing protein [Microbacterium lushaniae]QEW03900.1 PASTA domain-containing protein [Microbacterium lushaniae]